MSYSNRQGFETKYVFMTMTTTIKQPIDQYVKKVMSIVAHQGVYAAYANSIYPVLAALRYLTISCHFPPSLKKESIFLSYLTLVVLMCNWAWHGDFNNFLITDFEKQHEIGRLRIIASSDDDDHDALVSGNRKRVMVVASIDAGFR